MKQGNRKHIRLLAMAMSLAVVGMLAAFMALAAQPAPASAQDPCDGPLAPILPQCQGSTPPPTPTPVPPMQDDKITSDSTSGGAAPELKVVITSLSRGLAVGGSIVLYLEDDYQEPATIPASSVYFVAENPTSAPTGNGARVYTTIAPKIDTDDYFDADKSDISIRVFIPDMCTNATDACEGANGPMQGQKLTMVVEDNSGIKNPTEAGSHSAAFAILGPTDSVPGPAAVDKDFELPTWAKISLSDVDNIRGYELTITGSGFNDGTTAAVYVLHDPSVGSVAFDSGANEAALCERIVNRGTLAGGSLVGSDDRVSVTFVVTAPTFGPGNTNYICMVYGEDRMSHTDVERFHLEHSIRVSPSTVSAGDKATVFAQDYPNAGASFSSLRIAGRAYVPDGTSLSAFITSHSAIGPDGDATVTFEVPDVLEGTLRLDARWGNIEASTRITVREGGFTEPQFVGPVSSLAASADGQEAGAVRLIWSPAENAQVHFVIYVKSEELYAGNYASARMAPFSGSEGVITGLDGGTSYHFNVIGMRWNWVEYGAVWGSWTDWASATPVGADAASDMEPPLTEPQYVGRVANLTAGAEGQEAGAVRATWSEADNAQVHFVIYVKSEELYANNYASAQMAPFAGSEGLITGLDGGTSYHFNVIGMRWNWVQYGAVWGEWSAWAPATPKEPDGAAAPASLGDKAELTALYNATDGANWANNTNWLSDLPLNRWYGVTADDDERVTRLELNENLLVGTLLRELGGLSHLEYLNLEENQLTGLLPVSLRNLINLTELDVSGNQLGGNRLGRSPLFVLLGGNPFDGGLLSGQIPSSIGRLTNLKRLDLGDNLFTGRIPAELGHLAELRYLELDENNLGGQIPESLGDLGNLIGLELSGNNFTVCIPAGLRDVPENDLIGLALPYCDDTVGFASLRNALNLEKNNPQAAAAIKALSWVSDGITVAEKNTVERLVYIAAFHLNVFDVLIQLPWIVDSLTGAEASVINSIAAIAEDHSTAAERIIHMQFLEAIDRRDVRAMRCLGRSSLEKLRQILSHPTLNDGIDDQEARFIGLFCLGLQPHQVEFLHYPSTTVEGRTIHPPLSGEVDLAIIRTGQGPAHSLELLENAVRSIEEFVGVRFPTDYVALFFDAAELPAGTIGRYDGNSIVVLPEYDVDEGSHLANFAGRVIAHEVAHHYWLGNRDWIDEGASEFMTSISENDRIGARVEALDYPCRYATNIAELERLDLDKYPPASGCKYSLGQRIFLDLYRSLGDNDFRQGFRDLYLIAEVEAKNTRAGIEQIKQAFPENASTVIARWYDGTEPYDLSSLDTSPVDPRLPAINGQIDNAYITIGADGPVTSTFPARGVDDRVFLNLEHSYRISGPPGEMRLEVVEFYEDGFAFKRRAHDITLAQMCIRCEFRLSIGSSPDEPWAPGRYWVYVYDGDRKVAEVTYEVAP